MKLPFDFGLKLIFRLLVPGFILSLGFLPLLNYILSLYHWTDKFDYIFVLLLIFLGWLIVISDMWVYMIFEGRRGWPAFLRRNFIRSEKLRLSKLEGNTLALESETLKRKRKYLARLEERMMTLRKMGDKKLIKRKQRLDDYIEAMTQRGTEAYVDLSNFPLEDSGRYYVTYPSRLGNLLWAFEGYSKRVYGVDSNFFWWRIWLKLDKDTREEIDNRQALADSSIYTSFAFYSTGLIWLIYAILFTLQSIISYSARLEAMLPTARMSITETFPDLWITWILAAAFLSAGFGIYCLSLRLHAQFGEVYKSLFDVYEYKVNVKPIIKEIAGLTDRSPVARLNTNLNRKEELQIALRYLQFHRYRCPKCNALLKPSDIAVHDCRD